MQNTYGISKSCRDALRRWKENASAGNRTRVTPMATMYSATRPLMLLVGPHQPKQENKCYTCKRPWSYKQLRPQRCCQVAIAQLVARRSHNPKVVSSILTCHTIEAWLLLQNQECANSTPASTQARSLAHQAAINWSRGVTVSTLDSESSDRGSNPRGTLMHIAMHILHLLKLLNKTNLLSNFDLAWEGWVLGQK